jgi:hypothetical protein
MVPREINNVEYIANPVLFEPHQSMYAMMRMKTVSSPKKVKNSAMLSRNGVAIE